VGGIGCQIAAYPSAPLLVLLPASRGLNLDPPGGDKGAAKGESGKTAHDPATRVGRRQ
jgi:hypothetical protein